MTSLAHPALAKSPGPRHPASGARIGAILRIARAVARPAWPPPITMTSNRGNLLTSVTSLRRNRRFADPAILAASGNPDLAVRPSIPAPTKNPAQTSKFGRSRQCRKPCLGFSRRLDPADRKRHRSPAIATNRDHIEGPLLGHRAAKLTKGYRANRGVRERRMAPNPVFRAAKWDEKAGHFAPMRRPAQPFQRLGALGGQLGGLGTVHALLVLHPTRPTPGGVDQTEQGLVRRARGMPAESPFRDFRLFFACLSGGRGNCA